MFSKEIYLDLDINIKIILYFLWVNIFSTFKANFMEVIKISSIKLQVYNIINLSYIVEINVINNMMKQNES